MTYLSIYLTIGILFFLFVYRILQVVSKSDLTEKDPDFQKMCFTVFTYPLPIGLFITLTWPMFFIYLAQTLIWGLKDDDQNSGSNDPSNPTAPQ